MKKITTLAATLLISIAAFAHDSTQFVIETLKLEKLSLTGELAIKTQEASMFKYGLEFFVCIAGASMAYVLIDYKKMKDKS